MDNGFAIAKEHHKKIVEMFRRLDSREEHKGTGVGFLFVRRSGKHGSKLW